MIKAISSRDAGWLAALAAFVGALAAAGYLALAPMSASVSNSSEATIAGSETRVESGAEERRVVYRTWAEEAGWGAVSAVTLPPLLVAGAALLPRSRKSAFLARGLAAAVLWGWMLVGALSFGMFYTLSAWLLVLATVLALTIERKPSAGRHV